MLKSIIEKIENKERIDEQEALALYNMDMLQLGELAGAIRTQKYGKKSYFNINRHINPTNICKDTCKFCAYSATRKNPNPYTLGVDEI
ncbi:MAG TPA: aminofutalosine synthase MqnE, partial [Nitratifractor sp.]|nr:aminofutalosine synthase MqnE [Nitratifractor sp.]